MDSHARKRRILISTINIVVLILMATFFLYTYLYRSNIISNRAVMIQNIFIYATLYSIFVYIFELYKIGNIRLVDAFCGQIFATVGTNILFIIQLAIVIGSLRKMELEYFVGVTMVQFLLGLFFSYLIHQMYMQIVPRKRLLEIVGEKPEDTIQQNQMMANQYFEVVEIMSVNQDMSEIMEKARKYDGLLLGDLPVAKRNALIRRSFNEGIQIFYMLKIADILIQNSKKYKIYDQMFLMNHNHGLSLWQRFYKRVLDVVLSCILMIILMPLCLIIMFCIKKEDGGCIFYKQLRVTKDGKEFYIYKFRSMREDAEKAGPRLAQKEDGRVTKVGNIIRNLHFDEIPQLFNVIRGDMSLVGPRPERKIFIEEYTQILPEFESRLKVKAGLTGYAQIYGKYNSNPYDKLKLDLMYINHYSFFLDVKLMFQTVRILFQKENTEGVEEGQISALPKEQRKL